MYLELYLLLAIELQLVMCSQLCNAAQIVDQGGFCAFVKTAWARDVLHAWP